MAGGMDLGGSSGGRRSTRMSRLLGITSMVASLGAIAFLIASDVAQAGPKEPAPAQAQASETQPVKAAKAKPVKRKRIDLGRFEGY